MIKQARVFTFATALAVMMLLGAALSTLFVQNAFGEQLEGPLRADPSAYEHVDNEALHAQSLDEMFDGVVFAQANGTSNIVNLNLALSKMTQLQMANDRYGYSYDQFYKALDPNQLDLTVFADLRTSSGLTAAQIDRFIDSVDKGRTGMLHGLGSAFIEAESTYHVNAAYLVAHAILETGWGTSDLSKGFDYNGVDGLGDSGKRYPAGRYYNFFGIGAFDSSPLSGGRSKAVQEGWSSPRLAVLGGAKWIASNYIYRSTYAQPTLYAMKWDYARASAEGSCWHEYCTGYTWHTQIASLMQQCYSKVGIDPTYNYILPKYTDVSVPDTNSRAMYRLYNPNSGEHFYTLNVGEKENLVSLGWNDEGIGWRAPKTSNQPVYRLYNRYGGEHHYTLSASERDALVAAGWNDEGIGWYSADSSGTPLYRQYNPNAFANNHNYTTSRYEFDHNIGLGWRDEGIAWYGL